MYIYMEISKFRNGKIKLIIYKSWKGILCIIDVKFNILIIFIVFRLIFNVFLFIRYCFNCKVCKFRIFVFFFTFCFRFGYCKELLFELW